MKTHKNEIVETRTYKKCRKKNYDFGGYLTIKKRKWYLRLADELELVWGGKIKITKKWRFADFNIMSAGIYPINKNL